MKLGPFLKKVVILHKRMINMTKEELLQRLTDIEWDDFECKAEGMY